MNVRDRFWDAVMQRQISERKKKVASYEKEIVEEVYKFCITAQMLRTPENCARTLRLNGFDVTEQQCAVVIQYLFDEQKMGAFVYGKGIDPQPYMKQALVNRFPELKDKESYILEVGPGNLPIFDESEYRNWYGVDINYNNGVINFNEQLWGKNKYTKIYTGGWENLSEVVLDRISNIRFDLVCGSHSYEHNHKPVKALKESANVLKTGGILALFVPDGYSTWFGNYDRTHSMYLTSEMIEDLFDAVGCFEEVNCEQFRPNMDLIITAKRI